MLPLYKLLTAISGPILLLLLKTRLKTGKEDPARLPERRGKANINRPDGQLIWIHAASVGEAQSALILLERFNAANKSLNFLVTSGTVTSATLMAKRLPQNALHQFYPLDHPKWVSYFLDHWKPDLALWMESELWPNMLGAIKKNNIPAILVNARLSDRSYKRWKLASCSIKKILSAFNLILAQTDKDSSRYQSLKHNNVKTTGNIKYSAALLPFNQDDLDALKLATKSRKIWLYASTHEGEEELACRVHTDLKEKYPGILTIIVPRHPERRDKIEQTCKIMGLNTTLRGDAKTLPDDQTNIYIADTLGELGLFYRLSRIAMIGRSFSHDGGGGHNPIEAGQLDCAVLSGPHVQYQKEMFDDMGAANAVSTVTSEDELLQTLNKLLSDEEALKKAAQNALEYTKSKNKIVDAVIYEIETILKTPKEDAA